jgi:hypothetical protein
MALVDPNIAMSYRGVELVNPLAQYGQIAAIQNAQNQNALAKFQLSSAQRADEAATVQNELYAKHFDPKTGALNLNAFVEEAQQRGQGGVIPNVLKAENERQKAAADLKKTGVETSEKEFKLAKDKLNHGWDSLGNASTPQEAIKKLNEGVTKGYFDFATASAETQQLQNMTPEDFKKYRAEKVLGILDAKDKLAYMLPKTKQQDIGGSIVNIQDNPMMPGYGLPIAGAAIKKTMTAGEAEANAIARAKMAQDATGVVYQEDNQGNVIALPSKLKAGEVPTARLAVAPGGGFQPLQGKPSESVGKEQMSINQQKSIVQGAIDAVKNTPDAFGYATGNMPESVRSRLASSEENEARAFVFNVVSGVIKERAGTAQSAGEAATLARFLPAADDNAENIKDKLVGFQKYLDAKEAGTTKKRGGSENSVNTPIKITGDADYNKLPSGALFTAPDGSQRRKP